MTFLDLRAFRVFSLPSSDIYIYIFLTLLYKIIGCFCGEHTSVLAFAELWK